MVHCNNHNILLPVAFERQCSIIPCFLLFLYYFQINWYLIAVPTGVNTLSGLYGFLTKALCFNQSSMLVTWG